MQLQPSKFPRLEQSPLRAYAREAVMATRVDQVRGVLAWRVAQRLMDVIRARDRRISASLETVRPNEREFFLSLAHQVLELGDRIERAEPPTDVEVARYDAALALRLARARVSCQAQANRHLLGVWRPDPDRAAHELAACERCGGGASIHTTSGHESVSEELLAPCPAASFPKGVSNV